MNRFRYLLVGAIFLHLLSLWFDVGNCSYQLAIAPVLLGTLAAAGGSVVNELLNQYNARYSMNMQKELMDYEWNNYNSPAAQAKAYSDAGFNPAVAFGQGGLRTIAPSGNAPQLAQTDIGLSGQDLSGTILALAQAKKAGSETAGIDLDNQVKQATLGDLIKAPALANQYTQEQTAALTQSIGLMSANFQKIQQDIENAKSEKQLTDEKVKWFANEMQAKIDDLKASAKYKEAVANMTDSQKQLLDNTMDDLKEITGYQKDYQKAVVNLLNKYGDAQAVVGMISQLAGSAADLIGNFYKPAQVVKKVVSE